MSLRAVLKLSRLLRIQDTLLGTASGDVVDLGLPGRHACKEHLFHVFKRLAGSFGEAEESVNRHGGTEDAKDEVNLPLDADECGRDKIRQGKVEDPISCQ